MNNFEIYETTTLHLIARCVMLGNAMICQLLKISKFESSKSYAAAAGLQFMARVPPLNSFCEHRVTPNKSIPSLTLPISSDIFQRETSWFFFCETGGGPQLERHVEGWTWENWRNEKKSYRSTFWPFRVQSRFCKGKTPRQSICDNCW